MRSIVEVALQKLNNWDEYFYFSVYNFTNNSIDMLKYKYMKYNAIIRYNK